MSVLLSELAKWATKRSSLIAILEDGKESGDHCSQQPQWKYLCVCTRALASNLAMVTQHTWAACPFLSAGVSSSSQGPRRRMKLEQMVWGCSEIPMPRAVSSPARAFVAC